MNRPRKGRQPLMSNLDVSQTRRLNHWFWIVAVSSASFLASACATFEGPGQPLVPSQNVTRTGSFTIYTGRPIAADSPSIQSLTALEAEIQKRLGVRTNDHEPTVEIYVLKDREAFNHFLTFYYPELPSRRAFFLAQGSKRVIYTFENDRFEEDLRHEATHALLHEGVGDLPLWLDEGLAEYFEGPAVREGLNPEHIARLPKDLEKGWKPELKRLEHLKNVKDMTPRDYRESWAWIHYLLEPDNETGRATLIAYLADIQAQKSEAEPLSARLARNVSFREQELVGHIEKTRDMKSDLATRQVSTDSKILLQSKTEEPDGGVEAKPGFFGRFLGFFGVKSR